LVLIQ